jgi:hypothetical protein
LSLLKIGIYTSLPFAGLNYDLIFESTRIMPTFCDLTTVDFRQFAKVVVRRNKNHSSALRILSAVFPTPEKKKIALG